MSQDFGPLPPAQPHKEMRAVICSDAAAQRTPLDDARDAILGAVTGSLLHSIGQPLTIIRLAAERAAPDTCMDAAAVEVVVGQVTRLETVFLHLDALARAGRGPVRAQPVMPTLRTALDVLRPLAPETAPTVGLSATPEAADAVIEAPDGLVRLLSTALLHEALTSAQRKAVLTLTTSETPGHVAFQLKDDRSDRAPAPTAWTTAVVAEALGGRCRRGVFSPYRAIIDLPASRSTTTPTEKPGTHAAPAIPVSTSDAPPPRVLLVEDEMLIADTLADVLEDHGYSVEVRPTVTAALDYLATQVPDVVVTDLNLPDHRGEVLLECLTKDWPHVFTVVMSGRPLDTDTAAAAVDLVLNKPVASETLTTSLATLLSTASEPE